MGSSNNDFTTMSIERTIPIRGSEVSRRAHEAAVSTGDGAMQPGECHSSTDAAGFTRHFISHKHVGGYLYHGDVASEVAMLALDRPAYGHSCFPGDKCRRMDIDGHPVWLCIAGNGTVATDWVTLRGEAVAWSSLESVPTEFPPADHVHGYADLPDTFPPSAHTHPVSQITGAALSDSGDGFSLIGSAPFGLRKIIAGVGVTLAIVGGALEISAEGGGVGGATVTGTASDTFTDVTLGEFSSVETGWGWTDIGSSNTFQNPLGSDTFTGITLGTIAEVATGTGWTNSGTSYVP